VLEHDAAEAGRDTVAASLDQTRWFIEQCRRRRMRSHMGRREGYRSTYYTSMRVIGIAGGRLRRGPKLVSTSGVSGRESWQLGSRRSAEAIPNTLPTSSDYDISATTLMFMYVHTRRVRWQLLHWQLHKSCTIRLCPMPAIPETSRCR